MGVVAAKNSYFACGVGNTATNMSTFVTKVSGLPGADNMLEVTCLGATQRAYIDGALPEPSITVDYIYDSAASGPETVFGAWGAASTGTYDYYPAGSGTGSHYHGKCVLVDFGIESTIADVVKASATLKGIDPVTLA